MLATDRDILFLEPLIFRDTIWLSQRLCRGTASINENTLDASVLDVDFDVAGVGKGHIVTVGGVSYEVTDALDSTQLSITRLRFDDEDPGARPSPVTNAEMYVMTFRPQLSLVERQIYLMAGLDPDNAPDPIMGPRQPTPSQITNPGSLRHLNVLGALHLIFTAASFSSLPDSGSARRAAMYRAAFHEERARVRIELDIDGDGKPDVVRRLNALMFGRG
ncbi:MAG: hypothetical protein PSX37_00870 [bacterium]|nr:hypothetical protein [bacterium]